MGIWSFTLHLADALCGCWFSLTAFVGGGGREGWVLSSLTELADASQTNKSSVNRQESYLICLS